MNLKYTTAKKKEKEKEETHIGVTPRGTFSSQLI